MDTSESERRALIDTMWNTAPFDEDEMNRLTAFVSKEQLANVLLSLILQDLENFVLLSIGWRAAVEDLKETGGVKNMGQKVADDLSTLIASLTEKLSNLGD